MHGFTYLWHFHSCSHYLHADKADLNRIYFNIVDTRQTIIALFNPTYTGHHPFPPEPQNNIHFPPVAKSTPPAHFPKIERKKERKKKKKKKRARRNRNARNARRFPSHFCRPTNNYDDDDDDHAVPFTLTFFLCLPAAAAGAAANRQFHRLARLLRLTVWQADSSFIPWKAVMQFCPMAVTDTGFIIGYRHFSMSRCVGTGWRCCESECRSEMRRKSSSWAREIYRGHAREVNSIKFIRDICIRCESFSVPPVRSARAREDFNYHSLLGCIWELSMGRYYRWSGELN